MKGEGSVTELAVAILPCFTHKRAATPYNVHCTTIQNTLGNHRHLYYCCGYAMSVCKGLGIAIPLGHSSHNYVWHRIVCEARLAAGISVRDFESQRRR